MRSGAEFLQEMNDVVDVLVHTEAPGAQRHVTGVAPVRDVDVMIVQQRLDRVAQQRGEVAGERCHDQYAGLGHRNIGFDEVQHVTERQAYCHFLVDRHHPVASQHFVDGKWRTLVRDFRSLEGLGQGEHPAGHRQLGRPAQRVVAKRCRHACCKARGSLDITVSLIGLIQH